MAGPLAATVYLGPRNFMARTPEQLGFPLSTAEKQYCFEAFEVSQYAGKLTAATQQWLFPGSRS